MYVCEECGGEDSRIAEFEGGLVCQGCAEEYSEGIPVFLNVVRFGGKVVHVEWISEDYDGAPRTQAEVTTPDEVYRTDDEPGDLLDGAKR